MNILFLGRAAPWIAGIVVCIALALYFFMEGSPAASPIKPNTIYLTNLEPLTEAGIREALIGHSLTVEQPTKQNSPGLSEDFLADGSWTITRAGYIVETKTGTWRINKNTICTSRPEIAESCRQVWRDTPSGNIAMTDSAAGTAILIFVSSPL